MLLTYSLLYLEMMIINSENFEKVLKCFDDVLEGWIPALKNNELFEELNLGPIMRHDIPNYFESLDFIDNEKYIVNGSAGIGGWATVPWIGIFNKNITTGASKGYDIVYLFCEDMRGIYLSLNFGAKAFKERYTQGRGRRNPYKEKLKQHAEFYRKFLKEEYSVINDCDEINLGTNNLERGSPASEYEAGDIFNIFYSKEDIKNITEEEFLNDLKLFLELYDYLFEKRGNNVFVEEEELKKLGESPDEPENKSDRGGSKLDTEKTFYQELKEQGLYYNKETIENYLLSLKVKPFVILTGPSGTGKTKISKAFAEYLMKPIENTSEYIDAKITLNKNGSASITKYVNNFLPLDDYQGQISGFIDDVPVKFGFNVVAYIKFSKKFISEFIDPYYSEEDEIDIKIRKEDIKGFVSEPNFSGIMEDEYPIGVFPDRKIKSLRKEEHLKFFNIEEKAKSCEVIVDGNITTTDFYLSDSFQCLVSDESNKILDELKRAEKELFTLKLDYDSFIPRYPDGKESEGILESRSKLNYKIIPVGANWTENRNIVGFYNGLMETYQSTDALELLLDSKEPEDYPYFLILDEMNLSHVERYFSDFLSAMESGNSIPLHNAGEKINSENGKTIPKDVKINKNLFIIGTVNVDETTYMFSPKVLDRANTIEIESFENITIEDYMTLKAYNDEDFEGDESYLINPMEGSELRNKKIEDLALEFKDVDDVWKELCTELTKLNDALKPSGFEFGFRVVNEVIMFMAASKRYEEKNIKDGKWNNWERYFDAQIKQKILPKLHGSHQTLDKSLKDLLKICLKEEIKAVPKIEDFNPDDAKYPESAKKLIQMINTLDKQMYVSFIN